MGKKAENMDERREKIARTGSGGLDTPGVKAGDDPTSQSCRWRGKHPSTPSTPSTPNSHSCGSSHETFGELVKLLAQGLLTILLSHLATFRQGSSQKFDFARDYWTIGLSLFVREDSSPHREARFPGTVSCAAVIYW
jgi:hypothetical protein